MLTRVRTQMMRQAVWDRMWFFTRARDLLIEASKLDVVGAWSDKGEWLSWDLLCSEHEEEIFRDALRSGDGAGGAGWDVPHAAMPAGV